MIIRRIHRFQCYQTFLRSKNPQGIPSSLISSKPFSVLAQIPPQNPAEGTPNELLSEAADILGMSPETQTEQTDESGKLNKLEGEMSLFELLRMPGKTEPLSTLFENKAAEPSKEKKESKSKLKPLSPDMQTFVTHLYEKGYFKDCNALPVNKFDVTCFKNSYARDYARFAAEQFGMDNPEIAKRLSESDLEKVASFGCPSLARKVVFNAKGLRRFFGFEESTVCDKCVLKQSCKFVNQKGRMKPFDLALVMRVVPLYVLDSVHPQLVVPQAIKNSSSRLLREAVTLSQAIT